MPTYIMSSAIQNDKWMLFDSLCHLQIYMFKSIKLQIQLAQYSHLLTNRRVQPGISTPLIYQLTISKYVSNKDFSFD